jgi:hypothetical protein
MRAPEATPLEELKHILPGPLVDDLPLGQQHDIVEELEDLQCGLEQRGQDGGLTQVTICWMHLTIWKVVELSRPVEISSMNSTLVGPTSISPETKHARL